MSGPDQAELPAFPAGGDALRIEVLTSTAELRAIEPEWKRLWSSDPRATPFQSPEWLLPWWENVGEGRLFTLAVRDREHCLRGLLPLYIYTQPASGERHLLLLGAGTSDYLDGIFAPDHPPTDEQIGSADHALRPQAVAPAGGFVAEAALRYLARVEGAWDRAIFHQLREHSPLLRHARLADWPVHDAEACSIIAVSGWPGLPAKIRGNVGRYRRRASAWGRLHFRFAATTEEAALGFGQLIALHRRRWHTRGQAGVLSSPTVQHHHSVSIPKLLAAGMLRMLSMHVDDYTVGVLYMVRGGPDARSPGQAATLACYLIGFDPDYAELSPGTLLLAAAFDCCLLEGATQLDLLRGGEAYKQLWGAVERPTFRFDLPAHTSASVDDRMAVAMSEAPAP